MSKDEELFDDLIVTMRRFSPKTTVIPKSSSKKHKLFGAVLKVFGNPSYMEQYWTTIGFEIAQPGGDEVNKTAWHAIPHEGLHSYQAKKFTRFLFGMLYLLGTPVYCAPVLLASWPFFAWLPWWSGLAFVLPFLAISFPPFGFLRAHFEFQAYGLSIAQRYWLYGEVTDDYLDNRSKQFTTSMYFWMMPFKKRVLKTLNKYREDALSGKLLKDKKYGDYYAAMYAVFLKHGCVKKPYTG